MGAKFSGLIEEVKCLRQGQQEVGMKKPNSSLFEMNFVRRK